MATSGSTSVSVTSYDTLKFSWSLSSQSTANNTSTVAWKMQLISDSSGRISSTASKTWSVTVNGTSYSGTNTVGISASSTKTLASGSTTITHNSDGTKTFSYSFSQQFSITFSGSTVGTKSGSGTGTLTTIARASTITSASAVTLGNATSIVFTPKSTSFYYKIKFTLGSGSTTVSVGKPGSTSAYTYSYTMSLSTWAKYIPKATSATCTAVLYTYSDSGYSTQIGSTSSKTFTVTVPSSVVPSVSISIAPETDFLSELYLTGYSRPVVSITSAVDSYSTGYASISSVQTVFNGTTLSNTDSATFAAPTTAGTYTATTTVTDSRGRTASASTDITFTEYTAPTLSNVSFYRASDTSGTADSVEGTYGYLTFDYSISSANSNNTVSVLAKFKNQNTSDWTTLYSSTSGYSASISKYFTASIDLGYTVNIVVEDAITSTSVTKTISSAFSLIDLIKGYGSVGIGKMVTQADSFQVGLKSYFDNSVFIGTNKTGAYDGIAGMAIGSDGALYITSSGNPYLYFMADNSTSANGFIYYNNSTSRFVFSKTIATPELHINSVSDSNIYMHYGYSSEATASILNSSDHALEIMAGNSSSNSESIYLDSSSTWNSNSSFAGYIRLGKNGTPICGVDTNGDLAMLINMSTSNNVVIGNLNNTSGSVNIYTGGASNINFYTGGTSTVMGTVSSAGNIRIGNAAANTSTTSRVIYAYWADGDSHNLVEANYNGLTSYLGWAGSSSYATKTYIRGQACYYTNSSGTTTLSDKNLKEDFISLDDSAYDIFFDNLNPTAFKYILGQSGRHHFGYITQEVESALETAGLTTMDFGGVNIKQITDREVEEDEEGIKHDVYASSDNYLLDKGITEEHDLVYTEFIALNTSQIQKLKSRVTELESQVEELTQLLKGETNEN